MNKEKFIEMLNNAKEDEYGRLYVLGEYNNKIYFGTITTICEDIFKLDHSEENLDTAELYDRHFWNDDTFESFVVSTRHDKNIEYKVPKRIEEIAMIYNGNAKDEIMRNRYKINELIKSFNRYECLIEKSEPHD